MVRVRAANRHRPGRQSGRRTDAHVRCPFPAQWRDHRPGVARFQRIRPGADADRCVLSGGRRRHQSCVSSFWQAWAAHRFHGFRHRYANARTPARVIRQTAPAVRLCGWRPPAPESSGVCRQAAPVPDRPFARRFAMPAANRVPGNTACPYARTAGAGSRGFR